MDELNAKPHILSLMGVMASFSVAKKINDDDIKKITEKVKKKIKNKSEFNKLFQDEIAKNVNKDIIDKNIPGFIYDPSELSTETDIIPNKNNPPSINKKAKDKVSQAVYKKELNKLVDLTWLASLMSKEITKKRLDNYHMCFIINTMVNMMNLSETDFENFQMKFEEFKNTQNPDNLDDLDGNEEE